MPNRIGLNILLLSMVLISGCDGGQDPGKYVCDEWRVDRQEHYDDGYSTADSVHKVCSKHHYEKQQ